MILCIMGRRASSRSDLLNVFLFSDIYDIANSKHGRSWGKFINFIVKYLGYYVDYNTVIS